MGQKTSIFDIPITLCSLDEGVRLIENLVSDRTPKLVVLANAHTLNLAYEQEQYKSVLNAAALVLRDGTGVAWAVRCKGIAAGHNFVGTDFIPDFCRYTSQKGYRFFFLGSEPGVAEAARKNLLSLLPDVVVTGDHHGYFNDDQNTQIIDTINATGADILLVAMGNPKQEQWIARHLDRLNVPVCIGVGALFDYLSGRVTRAPQWMLDLGLEWIFRLLIEPKRMWKRYLIGNLKFISRNIRENLSA
jgi:N-acetylglucosaminyldiphosphoundecaprenol N-acetyl-beta-D-mannosaminyltransferase